MHILDKIIAHKRVEVAEAKSRTSLSVLKSMPLFDRESPSVSQSLKQRSGIIAEFKRRSPSKADININAKVEDVVPGYEKAGASACSVLTDTEFFAGTLSDLATARSLVEIPLLRKDFMIDPYQVYEAKAHGADIILLIAANLEVQQAQELNDAAHELGMETLLEVHNAEELEQFKGIGPNVVGVNNRNLKTFEVSLETSVELEPLIPRECLRISESGIHSVADMEYVKKAGFDGGLIGEYFMRQPSPGAALAAFIAELENVQA